MPNQALIAAREQAEQALRDSEARERAIAAELQALMDAVPAIIWISRDPECKEMLGNRYGYEFLRMWEGANISKTAPEIELSLQPYRNFKDGREIQNDELPMQIAAATGVGTMDYEFDLVFEDGKTKNVFGNVLPLFDQSGKPAGAVAAFVDITERKRVEDELRQNEAQLRKWKEYFDFWSRATNSTFWLLNPDGSSQANPLTYTGFQWNSSDRAKGWNWIDIFHPEDQEIARAHWKNAVAEQKPFFIESRVWDEASQEYRWFSHRAVPLLQDGTIEGWIGVSIDIQQRKEMEEIQRENEIKMATQRHMLEAREDERANIAREIHDGPIQTLIGTIFEIHNLKEELLDPSLKSELGALDSSLRNTIQELRQVVNELRPPTLVDFGLVTAIKEHVTDIREKNPDLMISFDLDENAVHLSEPLSLALYRVYQESIRNIIRHSKATKAAIYLSLEKDRVILEIQDNGAGFSFNNNFSRLTEEKHFGLAGMKERAEAVGGSFQISAEPSQGTKIIVTAPLQSG